MRTPSELSTRVERRLRYLMARARHRIGIPEPEVTPATLAGAFRHPIDTNRREELALRYRMLLPRSAEAEVAEAWRLMRHEFSLLGHRVDHGGRIAWSRDPVSGRDWERGFSLDIPYRGHARLGDIKIPWELNKHQYFFTLGKAAWLTGNAAFAVEIVRQIDDWINDNPCARGINWASALEVGTRAISWIVAYPFYADHGDAAFHRRLARSLAQHMRFVEGRLSIGRWSNTHLVGEAAALVAGGLFLTSRRSPVWLEKGLAIMDKEIVRQVTADGVHAERSIAYHRFFLDHYYLIDALLAANGRRLPAQTLRRMERMTGFLMDAVFPDGTAPAFGDCDDARGIWVHAECVGDYRSCLGLGAVLFDRGDFKSAAGRLPEEVLWLLGIEGAEKFLTASPRPPDHTSAAFPDAGYYVMRGGWEGTDPVLVFDCGPLGYGPAGHGHAGALGFQLCADGFRYLVDAGTYSYNLDYSWRDAFRGTRAHNTVVVDGQDQSIPGDRMSWKTVASTMSRRWISTCWFDLADGEHDGYRRFAHPVTHRRVVMFLKPDIWLIWDRLEGSAEHEFEALLHLFPGCSVEKGEAGVVLQSPGGTRLYARLIAGDGEDVVPAVLFGSEEERAAWFSPGYGVRVPANVLSVKRRFVDRTTLVTSIMRTPVSPLHVRARDRSFHVAVHREARVEDEVFYQIGAESALEADGISCDGHLVYSRKVDGRTTTLWVSGFRNLSVAGLIDARATLPVEALVLQRGRCDVTVAAEQSCGLEITTAAPIEVAINGRCASASSRNSPEAVMSTGKAQD